MCSLLQLVISIFEVLSVYILGRYQPLPWLLLVVFFIQFHCCHSLCLIWEQCASSVPHNHLLASTPVILNQQFHWMTQRRFLHCCLKFCFIVPEGLTLCFMILVSLIPPGCWKSLLEGSDYNACTPGLLKHCIQWSSEGLQEGGDEQHAGIIMSHSSTCLGECVACLLQKLIWKFSKSLYVK
jgi:hypothetical protein